jgi:hypothetical protein
MEKPVNGYLHPLYAQSFAAFGTPRFLPESRGWILERAISGSSHRDAMGCYPLFSCERWPALAKDLGAMTEQLVSVAMVIDPFGDVSQEMLETAFDRVVPFKAHFVADLSLPYEKLASKHHRYEARRALRTVKVDVSEQPLAHLDEWCALYQHLVERHNLRGIKAFSREAFSQQLAIPGMVMLRALYNGEAVSAQLWLQQGDVAYYHLASSNEEGYKQRAAYALSAHAIEYFAGRARYLDLGAGPGVSEKDAGGLAAFKQGWSSGTRPSFFCGKILNRSAYAELARSHEGVAYFPAYRAGELS